MQFSLSPTYQSHQSAGNWFWSHTFCGSTEAARGSENKRNFRQPNSLPVPNMGIILAGHEAESVSPSISSSSLSEVTSHSGTATSHNAKCVIHTQFGLPPACSHFLTLDVPGLGRTADQTRGCVRQVRRPLCSWRPAGGRRDNSHMLVSLQLRKLHDVQGADCRTVLGHVTLGGNSLWHCRCWRCCCCCCCWYCLQIVPKQGPAGTHSRDGGPAAARRDGPGCLEMWGFGGGSEGFKVLGGLREAEGDCVSVWGDICVGAVGLAGCMRDTGEGKALSQMNMLDCCRTWQSGHPCHKHLEALWVLSFPNEYL